jgi:hypothetical protein
MDFVRFCYRRRRVGWPDLYDEMCAVAGRGLYRGFGTEELSHVGIGLSLFELPALAALVSQVVAEDQARRRMALEATRVGTAVVPTTALAPESRPSPVAPAAPVASHVAPDAEPAERRPALVAAVAGA